MTLHGRLVRMKHPADDCAGVHQDRAGIPRGHGRRERQVGWRETQVRGIQNCETMDFVL
jgi:hypothetical protein